MLVYICCGGGATSSMFCVKLAEVMKPRAFVDDLGYILRNYEELSQQYEILLAYGPAAVFNEMSIREQQLAKRLSAIWIAPQARFMEKQLTTLFAPYDIPVSNIDMLTFGRMDVRKAMQDILDMQKK